MKRNYLGILVVTFALILAFSLLVRLWNTSAKANTEICFCHNLTHNPVTICTDNEGEINGHQAHVDSGMDSLGQCVVPTPTEQPATPSATLVPTVTLEPSAVPEPTVEPTKIPGETPFPQPCNGCGDHSDGRSSPPLFPGEDENFGPNK